VKCAAFRFYVKPKTTSVSDDEAVCQRFDDTDVDDVIDAIKKGVPPPHIKKVRNEDGARLMEKNS
jgi:hypothetical protein